MRRRSQIIRSCLFPFMFAASRIAYCSLHEVIILAFDPKTKILPSLSRRSYTCLSIRETMFNSLAYRSLSLVKLLFFIIPAFRSAKHYSSTSIVKTISLPRNQEPKSRILLTSFHVRCFTSCLLFPLFQEVLFFDYNLPFDPKANFQ